MVDRQARTQYAELLRHFIAGRMTNMDYEKRMDVLLKSSDPAIWAVYDEVWPVYCDLRTHTMSGEWRLDRSQRRLVARLIMFLYSDLELKWPVKSLRRSLAVLFTLGYWAQKYPMPGLRDKDLVYPFFRQSDYQHALRMPRLLSGRRGSDKADFDLETV